jgi:hypothetical protein
MAEKSSSRASFISYFGEMLNDAKLVRCRKCGKPLGYVTVVGKALRFWLPFQNVKLIGTCIDCFQKE